MLIPHSHKFIFIHLNKMAGNGIRAAALSHLNKSRHRDYQSYYNEKTKDMIAEYFT